MTLIAQIENLRRHAGYLQRYPRHLKALLTHATVKKLANFIHAEAERLLRCARLKSRPYYYWIDVNNICNLRCPLCDTGRKALGRPRQMMDFELFKSLFAKIEPYALEVCLYNWGEPLLNPDIYRMIAHVAKHRIGTNLSTNFSFPMTDAQLEKLARSGLEQLIVSLDGIDQTVYEIYRQGGNIQTVRDNVQRLHTIRERLGVKTPQIEWQFIVFKHNEHQRDEARRRHQQIGFDTIRFSSPGLPYVDMFNTDLAARYMPQNKNYWQYNPNLLLDKEYIDEQICHYLYRTAAVNPDGGLTPCCFLHEAKHDFGDLKTDTIDGIWNNAKYLSARSLFAKTPLKQPQTTCCDTCPLFKQPNNRPAQKRLARARAANRKIKK